MPESKSVFSQFQSRMKAAGEAVGSLLQQPIPPIPFPAPKRAKPPAKKKPDAGNANEPRKAAKRSQNCLVQAKPQPMAAKGQPYSRPRAASGVFTLTQNREEFERILFVLRACNKYSSTAWTNALHVEQSETGSRLVATDGKRMHVAEIETRIKPGNYKPIVSRDAVKLGIPLQDIQFPDWKKAVPQATARCGAISLENTAIGKAQSTAREKSRVYDSFVKQSGERVNPRFLEDLTKKRWIICCQGEKRKPVLLREEGARMDAYAVIMPLSA